MPVYFAVFALTTVLALLSVYSAEAVGVHQRVLPWTGGLLLGIGAFWILPELAEQRGWMLSSAWLAAALIVLALVNQYVYPICPVCATGEHSHSPREIAGWPLLAAGCIHSLLDGWMIAQGLGAMSWGFVVHKLPEALAVGFLAARLAPSRRMALGAVCVIQAAMLAGGLSAGFLPVSGNFVLGVAACATLLLFGFLAIQEEQRHHGTARAIYATVPGLAAALLGRIL